MPKVKFTRSVIHKLSPPEKGQVDYYDADHDPIGFGLRVTSGGTMTFMVYRRIRGEARKTYIPIGKYGEYTIEAARKVARDYVQKMSEGVNPHPRFKPQESAILTLADVFRQYIETRKTFSEGTVYQYGKWIDNYFADWKDRDVTTITGKECVNRLAMLAERNGVTQSSNAMKLLRTLYKYGMAMNPEQITANPVATITGLGLWPATKRRQTMIEAIVFPQWFKAVIEYDNPKARDYLLFILFTGLRKMEAARLKWDDIDFQARTFSFVPEKKKEKESKITMPLVGYLQRLLLKRRKEFRETSEYVFPGRDYRAPHISNSACWLRDIEKKSGVTFCLHDLRRTFITIAESLDIPHFALKALLNHSMGTDVTGGYVVMKAERLREPSERVAARILELATAKEQEQETTAA